MKFISKLLYSLVSFTIFTAYKVENAFAAIKFTLASSSTATAAKCATYPSILEVRGDTCGTTTDFTMCQKGYYLVSCAGVMASTASAAMLASVCSNVNYVTCSACPDGGTTADTSTRNKPKQTTVTICSYHYFTDNCGTGYTSLNDIKLRTYTVTIDNEDKISANFLTNCYLPSGTATTDGTGTYTSTTNCDYK